MCFWHRSRKTAFEQWRCQPKILRGQKNFFWEKCLTLSEQQHFCLGRRFSKHKMTKYVKNWGAWPPGYAYACESALTVKAANVLF